MTYRRKAKKQKCLFEKNILKLQFEQNEKCRVVVHVYKRYDIF